MVPPAALPVSLDEIEAHLRVETADEDVYLGELAAAAVAHVEAASGKRRSTRPGASTSTTGRNGRGSNFRCRRCAASSPSMCSTNRACDRRSPLAVAARRRFRSAAAGRRRCAAPARAINGIEIEVAAGYGESGTDVPDGLKRAILVLAAHWYEARGSAVDAAALGLEPAGFRKLLAPFRRPLL